MQKLIKLLTKPAFWLSCLAVVVLSLSPSEDLPADLFDWWDKAQHFVAFLVLGYLGFLAFPSRTQPWICGWLLLFGGAIEFVQSFLASREGDVSDLVADALGIIAALLLYRLLARQKRRRKLF